LKYVKFYYLMHALNQSTFKLENGFYALDYLSVETEVCTHSPTNCFDQ